MPRDWSALAAALAAAAGRAVQPQPARALRGGCIAEAWRWETAGDPRSALFVKTAPAPRAPAFDAEARGLAELAAAAAVRVPAVLGTGEAGGHAWLALEWLELAPAHEPAEAALGEQLARLHRCRADRYGWERDGFIGATPQANGWCDDWVEFLRERRLRPQLALARDNGCDARLLERGALLLEVVDVFYGSYRPAPSLLHGDLWGGNWAMQPDGTPVVFDPAVYYGDREADLAMTRLFGGFGSRFYTAYHASWPLDQAWGVRRDLHNLYHVLNHYNLFGGDYLPRAAAMIDRLLAETGR